MPNPTENKYGLGYTEVETTIKMIDGTLNTTANKSLRSRAWSCTLWCDLCHVHKKPCITYLCVNQATPSMNRKVPMVIIEQRIIVNQFMRCVTLRVFLCELCSKIFNRRGHRGAQRFIV